ncbi:hypothetical protein ACQU0X_26365 [Pseudovibrio ascidiaceicola]|uniref:hypothetical protein n=1 Tax=Pseudovibrio ascidiaceicola TaxID=285279 RepID=UPI003D35A5F9
MKKILPSFSMALSPFTGNSTILLMGGSSGLNSSALALEIANEQHNDNSNLRIISDPVNLEGTLASFNLMLAQLCTHFAMSVFFVLISHFQ